jgi:hypothetical protein
VNVADYVIDITLSVFLIFGVYQFYFWTQRNSRAPIELKLPIDDWIPFIPEWVWIYSGLYYPIIIYVNLVMQTPQQFTHTAMSFIVLLFLQMACFLALPVHLPESWRAFDSRKNISTRFLGWVQAFDGRLNCFPSMHASVAVMTALHIRPVVGEWCWAFPVVISIACLFTKQHYIIDLPAGAALAGVAWWVSRALFLLPHYG